MVVVGEAQSTLLLSWRKGSGGTSCRLGGRKVPTDLTTGLKDAQRQRWHSLKTPVPGVTAPTRHSGEHSSAYERDSPDLPISTQNAPFPACRYQKGGFTPQSGWLIKRAASRDTLLLSQQTSLCFEMFAELETCSLAMRMAQISWRRAGTCESCFFFKLALNHWPCDGCPPSRGTVGALAWGSQEL